MPLQGMNALCGRGKVSLNRGPIRKSETPPPPKSSGKGFLSLSLPTLPTV